MKKAAGQTALSRECERPRAEWIWCDDFEEDRSASYFEIQRSRGSFMRDSGSGVAGSFAMRGTYRVGQAAAGALHVAFGRTPGPYFRPVDEGRATYREIWWRVYVRTDADWTGGGGYKLSRATVFTAPDWAQAMIAHVWAGQGARSAWLVLDPATGTTPAGVVRTRKYNDFPNLRFLGSVRGTRPLFAAEEVGRWHCVEAHVRLNDPGAANGQFELWIDDRLDARRDGLNWLGSYTAYGVNAVLLENYWNDGAPRTQSRYFDNFVIATRRIGCSAPTD